MTFKDRDDYVKMDGTYLTQDEIDYARQLRNLLVNNILPPERLYEDEIELLLDYEFYTVECFHSYDNTVFPILVDALFQFIDPWSVKPYLRMIHKIGLMNKAFEKTHPEIIEQEKTARIQEMCRLYEKELKRREEESKFRPGDEDL